MEEELVASEEALVVVMELVVLEEVVAMVLEVVVEEEEGVAMEEQLEVLGH